jgi:peptidoglycan hydrolase-like protein with peptidoglycan-binding domain
MTPFRLRLLVVTFLGLATAISINALYLQDASLLASSVVSEPREREVEIRAVAHTQPEKPQAPEQKDMAALPAPEAAADESSGSAAGSDLKAPAAPLERTSPETVASIAPEVDAGPVSAEIIAPDTKPVSPRVIKAIQRQLSQLGYGGDPINGNAGLGTRSAILAYEFDKRMPLSGEPSEALLEALIFDTAPLSPELGQIDRFEDRPTLTSEVQTMLARLGYGASAAHGRLDEATREAIRKFEADRNLESEGRLTPRVLLEMVIVTGHPFEIGG